MTYNRQPLGIESIPPADIFKHLYQPRRESWFERNEVAVLVGIGVFVACVVGLCFRCM